MSQRYDLVLVTLTDEQIARAKEANGKRKRITHALLCGPFGQMFGTENQCWKYYASWREIFPELFKQAFEADEVDTEVFENDFESTDGLVLVLMDEADRRGKPKTATIVKQSGCLVSMFVLWPIAATLAGC